MILRQKQILEKLESEGEITIKELAARLNVSEMTIHRDVDFLQAQCYVYKKRGSVMYVEGFDRSSCDFYADEKRVVGIKAASLIKEGQSVIFDNSTTAMECTRFFDPSKKYIFYTTSIESASILASYEKSVMYCSGGYYFSPSKGFVGGQAEEFVSSIAADVCIIGASGVSLEGGITTPYPMHTSLQRAILLAAKTKILVCDHSKFSKIAMEKICNISDVDMIVTDSGLSNDIYEAYANYVEIIRA